MQDFWPSSGFHDLERRAADGWLTVTPRWIARLLARPELAPIAESCAAERALHAALVADPLRAVNDTELANIRDQDARENYGHFLAFRDGLVAAGTLEAWYLATFRAGRIDLPPLFVDLVCQAILRGVLNGCEDVYRVRAAEMFYRRQRVSVESGQVLAGDAESIEYFAETGGFGNLGRLLSQQNTPMRTFQLDVLSHETAQLYWLADERYKYVLDLTQGRDGLFALAAVLEQWVRHFTGIAVRITPQQQVADEAWRWHVGLDVTATALLNDLYEGREVDPERLERLISLFRLEFENPADMRADLRASGQGRPVYLGLAMTAEHVLKLKPQNLLINLPLAARS
ncbi:MAG: DUF6352 family protein [Burkholderiales bacterium]|nr:DUF6352 family protein [Burkholderiales bacterium]